jgi:hypothetical protein
MTNRRPSLPNGPRATQPARTGALAWIRTTRSSREAASDAIVAVACAVYGWWGWSMAQAARGSRAALPSLLVLCGFWAVAHGASFVFTPLTEYVADIIHFGSLIFGIWAAYATWRALRGGRVAVARAQ